jgi:hypothetical protein
MSVAYRMGVFGDLYPEHFKALALDPITGYIAEIISWGILEF